MSNQSDKIKNICNGNACSFKSMVFSTFDYMLCTNCKCEVTEDLVEYKAREKAVNTLKLEDDKWYDIVVQPKGSKNYHDTVDNGDDGGLDDAFYPYDLFKD